MQAATAGPGLIVCLSVGLNFAKALSLSLNKPFIGVNHLEGHALSPKLQTKLDYPYLLLLISGGHSQFLCVNGLGDYKRLGTTIDDALGEAFDKTAKLGKNTLKLFSLLISSIFFLIFLLAATPPATTKFLL